MNKGLLAGFSGYLIWGILPIYWRQLSTVSAQEILAHRILWSFIFLLALLSWQGDWGWLKAILRDRKTTLSLVAAAVLLAVNWMIFIWSINAGYLVESSLGYFINPLVNVLFGVILFGERLRSMQWLAIGLAVVGVLYLTWIYGRPPYIALALALSFGTYGVLKKRSTLKSAESLAFEVTVLLPLALIYLAYLHLGDSGALINQGGTVSLFLLGSGVVTTVPLMLFAYGARNVTLTTMGILQYIAPSLQLMIGVLLFNELFDTQRLLGFALIWAALVVYSAESLRHYQRQKSAKLAIT